MRRAYAMSVVLWIVAAMSAVTMLLATHAKQSIEAAEMLQMKLIAQLEAESILEELNFYAATGRFTLNAVHNSAFQTALPSTLFLDGRNMTLDSDTNITLQDTASMLTLLYPNSRVAAALSDSPSAPIMDQSLQDWMDTDEFHHLNGAESTYYRQQRDSAFHARNRRGIQSAEELMLIKGFDTLADDQKEHLRTHFAYAPPSAYNLATADPLFLQALLGTTPATAQALIADRNHDINVFLSRVHAMSAFNPDLHFTSPSGSYRVRMTHLHDQAISRIDAVIGAKPHQHRCITHYRFLEQ
ncbi:MAG: general secretion pathway protein GspK [Campylobacterales bacterium]|nr:general secretion pathway protein GspK [Campylobacterales bacterium]